MNLERFREMPPMKGFPMPNGEGFRTFTLPGDDGRSLSWAPGNGRQIGVGVTDLTKQLAQHFGVEDGLMINEVRKNSPAAKAGLKAGDIIVEANGKAVKSQFDLMREVSSKKEGDVQLTFVRDGKRQTVSITPEVSKGSGFVFDTKNDDN